MVREILTFVCVVVTVDGVTYAAPEHVERCYEAEAPCIETDGAEVVEVAS